MENCDPSYRKQLIDLAGLYLTDTLLTRGLIKVNFFKED